ncbi:hypothetical protein ACOSQ4_030445 [Xanthoceras sorbifolium]
MLQQSASGGVQPNQDHARLESGSGVQPNQDHVPSGSSEEPQLSAVQNIATHEIWTGERLNYYRPLFNAGQNGDWKTVKSFINRDPNALTARITVGSRTILHVAAICCQWGLVLKLLELVSLESLAVQDVSGNTVLHFVAEGGSLKTAKALVKKNRRSGDCQGIDLLQILNSRGDLPLLYSIYSGKKELVWYFTLITRVESPAYPFFVPSLPMILRILIQSGFLDIALYFVRRYPNLALTSEQFGYSLLWWLAFETSHFFSGSKLGFFKRWIYKFVRVEIKDSQTHLPMVNMEDFLESTEGFPALETSIQSRTFTTQVLRWFKRLFSKTIAHLAPSIKMVRDAKLKHIYAVELVNHVCTQLSSMSFQQIIQFLDNPKPIMGIAVAGGIEEIVRTLLQHFPDLIEYNVMLERNILQVAIEYRQEKIVNIIKKSSRIATMNLCGYVREAGNTTLHLAGKLAPAFKLYSVSGAALQMQRELRWFKEVEKMTFPFQREWKNMYLETAKDVFRISHKELAEQGEKWMKDTSNSCMLVSTLIATVLFAAAFTVPGGNVNDKGIPIFLRTNAFTVFSVSDALGLFSSLTSLLMFLAILTARYAVDDFLESLPKKLIIGLGSLFFAIAAMIIAFGATLAIVLNERWQWVTLPITLLASFPVAIFVMLQLPLFVQMVQSTYGSSMFHTWPSRV